MAERSEGEGATRVMYVGGAGKGEVAGGRTIIAAVGGKFGLVPIGHGNLKKAA